MKDIVRARYTLEFKQEGEAAQSMWGIDEHRTRLVEGGETLSSVARTLGVSFQSVDNWVDQPHRCLSDKALLTHVMAIFNEMKGVYGWPRLWREPAAREGWQRIKSSTGSTSTIIDACTRRLVR